ncbi:MAG: tRNA (N6-isopentenyl adenosine(37)-C2)-methylthiotransferase MiaB [Oscillospiraceae bacterium]|nr:tRNA (N6-isopentenyl adenosine(37)-C2)-methylthiotransferase MiaB [Oscillospiraceae bacterium]
MGCKLNENDSEKLSGMAEEMGYKKTEEIGSADLYIINTCCVRQNAEEKVFGKIGELKRSKEKSGSIIAVGGCMMQEPHVIEKLNKSYPYIDVIFGTHTLHQFAEDLYKVLTNKEKVRNVIDIDGKIYEGLPVKREDGKKASVTIMNGCNNFCSYCIVPYVRGRERSRKPEDILNEVKELASEGYKEILLLGQNVNSYVGTGAEGETAKTINFAGLLEEIDKVEGIEIIKFISPHPKDFKDDVIEVIAKSSKISKIIHIPVQSGSTKVLEEMNRKYSKEQYLELISKIKARIPEVSFSTDIIVGFPGETEEDFEDTLDVVRKVNYEQVYMFIYSKRVGTPAAERECQVEEKVKHERFNRLKKLVDNQVEANNKKYIGTVHKILVEGYSKNNEEMLTGRTDSNKVVVFQGEETIIGQVVEIKIVSDHKWYLKGDVVK